jgi:hypothetical protein
LQFDTRIRENPSLQATNALCMMQLPHIRHDLIGAFRRQRG